MLAVINDLFFLAALGYLAGLVFSLATKSYSSSSMFRYGAFAGTSAFISGASVLLVWMLVTSLLNLLGVKLSYLVPDLYVTASVWGFSLLSVCACLFLVKQHKLSKTRAEKLSLGGLGAVTILLASALAAIFLTLVSDALVFFSYVSPFDFFFGLEWKMQGVAASAPENLGSHFGVIPLLVGTFVISGIAVCTAIPLSIPAATYMSEYANERTKHYIDLLVRILAGIPTIVYGFFALSFFGPALLKVADYLGLEVAAESALIAGFVTGLMIVPITTSIIYETMIAVPDSLREGSFSLGATKAETIVKVVLPASKSGILVGILLALSRAVGETMIVVMAAGVQADLTINPLRAMTTVTVQIVRALSGDAAFDNPITLAAFALGAMLLIITVSFNSLAMLITRHNQQGGKSE